MIDKEKLRVVALEFFDAQAQQGEGFRRFFERMGYRLEVQLKSLNKRTGRRSWNNPPSPVSRKELVVRLTGSGLRRATVRYWLCIPREVAKKALVLGFLAKIDPADHNL